MTSKKDIVLSVKNVSKDFHLPHEKSNSIKSGVVGLFKKKNKEVDTQHALKDISFEVQKGEFFGILGRNGSGKSTMLKMLAEIYQPTSGSVRSEGKLVPFIELGVGFNPELTGRENVYLNGALLGFSRKEINEKYDEIVAFAELEEFMDQKLKNYSSGMQVRLAFSVATHAEADILVVDEVLAVGDADFQRKCYDYFKGLKKTHKTVIFVTHDMGAVREYCDRAVLITDGLIACEGDADIVADEYLKLFNKSSDDTIVNTDERRWGNGSVRIENFEIKTNNKQLTINLDLRAGKNAVEEVVFGYRLLDGADHIVMGGNTINAGNKQKLTFKPGEVKHLVFTMPNILGNGTFSVGGTARLSDGVTICDEWNYITQFSNTKDEGHYPIVAPAVLEVK